MLHQELEIFALFFNYFETVIQILLLNTIHKRSNESNTQQTSINFKTHINHNN